jgi:hypothetical protein
MGFQFRYVGVCPEWARFFQEHWRAILSLGANLLQP